mgnify:CR=1 FL=1
MRLSKGKTAREKQNIAQRISEILVKKGFTGGVSTVRRGLPAFTREGREVDTTSEDPVVAPPVTLNQVTPSAQVPTLTPQAQAQPSSGPTDPNTRARYASLFPNDPISGMLNSGGIASLGG